MSAAIKWGLITGAVYIIHSLVSMLVGITPGNNNAGMMGISLLLNALLLGATFFTIYSGIKEIRDLEMNGYIEFGSAFRQGMKIALIAGVIAAVFALLNMLVINPGMMEEVMAASEEQFDQMDENQQAFGRKMMSMFTNPFAIAIFTIIWVAFWGVIKSLIAASMLKKEAPPTFNTPVV
jgi:hypothetical protein